MIILVSIGHVIVTDEVTEKEDVPFREFQLWWGLDLLLFLVKAGLHLYSICLILNSTSIMKKIARKKGNLDGTRDIRYITIIGVLCFLGFCIEFIGFLSATILLALNKISPKNRESARSVANCLVSLILYIAYSLLIQIFWQYVININETRK